MEGTYDVYSAGQIVGSVVVTRQGLFYQFLCRCDLSGDVMFRLILCCDDLEWDLGILTPTDGKFGMNTKWSTKKLGQGRPKFYLKPNRHTSGMNMVKICPEEPFAYLTKLQDAYLRKQRGEMYLVFHNEK